MKFGELNWALTNKPWQIPERLSIQEVQEKFCINDLFAIPVEITPWHWKSGEEIEVHDCEKNYLGTVVVSKNFEIDLDICSDNTLIAYLNDVPKEFFGEKWFCKTSYLLLNKHFIDIYHSKYEKSAPFWGGFSHHLPERQRTWQINNPPPLIAREGVEIPSQDVFSDVALLAIRQSTSLERFLRLYQLLELRFDLDIVRKINSLGDDLQGVGKVFVDIGRSDIDRLKFLVENSSIELSKIEEKINFLSSRPEFNGVVEEILFIYGKESNPLKEKKDAFFSAMSEGGISKAIAKKHGIVGGEEPNLSIEHRKKLLAFLVYLIYRVRCSIAHNRIGEYILTTDNEALVAEWAEPILRELVLQVYSS